ncbi:MAG TPA: acyclic terpene utilization AtuA family protein, partial [Ramlibacter sp.]|nr:acyclic terpene utilization AtuA family protein [Ramlibacter sp.]
GHVLECGPQATGGVFTDWERVPDWANIGYPIAECRADGSFTLTKPPGTGGLVDTACIAEQVLYEIGDPRAYVLPDVVADFSRVRLTQLDEQHVRVEGAIGRPPTSQYKVSATYQDGYRAVAIGVIIGLDAVRKAERSAQELVARARTALRERGLPDLRAVHIEALGGEASYLAAARARDTREVVMRVAVEHPDAKALDLFAREIGSMGLGFAQGTAALIGGRPKPTPVVRLFTFFIDKARLNPLRVQVAEGDAFTVDVPAQGGYAAPGPDEATAPQLAAGATAEVPLLRLAHARSGDKGNGSNIAIFCRKPGYRAHLAAWLTPERVAKHFAGTVHGAVTRYEAPGLDAFNFVLDDALGGGGMASMRIDAQGKAFGQRLLEIQVPVPPAWAAA